MQQKIPFVHMAAVTSVFAPIVSVLLVSQLGSFIPWLRQFDPRTLGMVVGILAAVLIVVGLMLSITALFLAKEHGLPNTKSTAIWGLVLNLIGAGLFIAGMILYFNK